MLFELFLALLLQNAGETPASAIGVSSEVQAPAKPTGGDEDANRSEVDQADDIVVSGEAPKPEPVHCRYEKVIGSGIKKKICRTESQVRAEAAAARGNANTMSGEMRTRSAGALNENR